MTEGALSWTTANSLVAADRLLCCHAAKWGPEEDLRSYAWRNCKRIEVDGVAHRSQTMLSSHSRDEWESAVRSCDSVIKVCAAGWSSIRSSESFERLRQRRESCSISWRKVKMKVVVPASRTVYFHTVSSLFFLPVWFFTRQNYSRIYDGKHDLRKVLRLIRKIY